METVMKYITMLLACLLIIAMCGCDKNEAEFDTLGKLRTTDWDVWCGDGGYDLVLMGDEAAPFLVQVLTDENEDARQHAHYFLDRYYANSSVLPELTELFLKSEDDSVRQSAASLIASVDAVYTRNLMIQCLDDEERQDIAENMLIHLKDERVIPRLIAKLEDPKADQAGGRYPFSVLASFDDKRATPSLLEILHDYNTQPWTRDEVVEKLANIGDERAIPVLLDYIGKRNILSDKIISALSQSDTSIVQPLLKKIEQLKTTRSSYTKRAILEIFGNQKNPAFIPIYEKVCLETDDSKLQAAMARALGNMGEEGFESLLKIARKKPNSMVLNTLATHNSTAAIDSVTSFAVDESFPLRPDAIKALTQYGGLWKDKVYKHITQLLADVNPKEKYLIIEELTKFDDLWEVEIYKYIPQLLADTEYEVRILTIDLIRRLNLTVMAPALKKLMQNAKGRTLDAAHMVYDILTDKPQLELKIKMDQQRYDYEQPITLTYRIINVSDHDINIALYESLKSRFLELEIQQPDGTLAEYIGPIAQLSPLTLDDFQTLHPSDEITVTISISKYYHLNQDGVYNVQLHVAPGFQRGIYSEEKVYNVQLHVAPGPREIISDPKASQPDNKKIPLSKKIKTSFLAWSDTLSSSKVHFSIEPPTADKVNQMIASIDPEIIAAANAEEIVKTCYKLSALRNPKATDALKELALIDVPSPADFRHELKLTAGRVLMQSSDPEIVPIWIDILNRKKTNPVSDHFDLLKLLGESGNVRAIEPLRQIAFRQEIEEAALAMQQLGDNSGVEWFKKVAFRKLRHWKKRERRTGALILARLYPRSERIYTQLHNLRDPWFYAENYEQLINWTIIHEKAGTVNGLEELLKHENYIIQLAAAYELAYRGDPSGAHFIRQDLNAKDSESRLHARHVLFKLQSE